jgi:hypothetical protein
MTAAPESTALGSTAQGSTAQGSTAQGSTAQGSTAEASITGRRWLPGRLDARLTPGVSRSR